MPRKYLQIGVALALGLLLGVSWRLLSSAEPEPSSDSTHQDAASGAAQAPMTLSPRATPDLSPASAAKLPPPAAGLDAESQARIQQIYGLFVTGNYAGALEKADLALEETILPSPVRAWIIEQMPALLISAGWSSLKLGDCETAISHLRRAAALKKSLETSKGLALCYFKQKNMVGAEEQFHTYFEMGENDPTMQLLYADLMESESRYEEAVGILEKLETTLKSAPPQDSSLQRESLQQRLTSMRGRAKVGQDQRAESSRNFRLSFRSGEHEELVAWVTSTLEEALDQYVEDFGFRLPPTPIEVLLYPSQDFSSVMVGSPNWAEGLFDGRIRIPVKSQALKRGYEGDPEMSTVLRHELVHALFAVMTGGRSLPPWFDEGVAQRLSCPREGCAPFAFPPTPGDFLAESHFLMPFTSFNTTMAGRAYQQGLYLVLTLEQMRGDTALREIVTHLSPSTDLSSDGLLKSLGLSFAELHKTAGFRWTKRWYPSK